jgi:phosphatidylglycerophosphate synthase
MSAEAITRRPLRSRQKRWATALAARLTARGVRPNQISLASVVFAALAGGALLLVGTMEPDFGASRRSLLLVVAAGAIQLRLLCNLLDGMVAVEGGLRSKSGEVFNELPDRVSDALILVGAGYATAPALGMVWAGALGSAAALLAVLTAYVRSLGASLGTGQDFRGPMAKPHRMAALTAACLVAAVEPVIQPAGDWRSWGASVLAVGLAAIAAGSALTVARRTRRVVDVLEAR